MKKIKFLALLCFLNFSCSKNIEIDKNGIFIRGGIDGEFIIRKVINNNADDTLSFPNNFYVKEAVRLKIGGNGISMSNINGQIKYSLNGKLIDLNDKLEFQNKNQYYHWIKEKPIDNIKYEVLPMEFEKGYWYSIRDIRFRDSNCYFEFYVNKNGEFQYNDIEYIHLSPI